MSSKECILPNYDTLTPEQINKVNESGFVVRHKRGEFLFSQDKPISYLMFLSSGLVKIFREDQNKKSIILKIISPGNYIGLISAFYGNRYQFSAAVLENSELVYISIPILKEILSENGRFALQMIQQFSSESMYLVNKLLDFPQKQIPGRIAEVLLFFSTEIYGDNHFILPLSRQELAELVYSTKESVSRTMTEFKNDRMIDIEDRKITLNSIDLLKILSKLG
ncbi:MAG: Crp/Fnr family transcriptional regulator [Bacteroidales bacterium]|nr:Crp/Fnr family transcriptional regulator [Bacteroidales bacterium]